MKCPRCSAEMRTIDYEGAEIETCPTCGGEWLDQGERLVFATTTADGAQLCVARTNGADADALRPLVVTDQGVSDSFALSPDHTRVLFSATVDGATRLCSAQVEPDDGATLRPVPLTTVTDADERLVGWVP